MAKRTLKVKDYEQLGRQMAHIYETGYMDKGRMLKISFLKGAVTGFGGVIGATIVVGLVVWALSLFKQIPLIGPVVDDVRDSVQQER